MDLAGSLATVVLTLNEEENLPACLASLEGLGGNVFIVDSGSTDRTRTIAQEFGCHVFEHSFENYAAQRNWSFDNLPLEATWVLCLDADERLTSKLVNEIRTVVSAPATKYDGYLLKKRTIFMGRWLRFGGQYPSYHLRLFRVGRGRCEDRLYDQHFLVDGATATLENDYLDVLSSDLTSWAARHNHWASLEAQEILRQTKGEGIHTRDRVEGRLSGNPMERKRFLRDSVYLRFPLFVRPFLFWFYGYVLRGGFLDGAPGFIFHTLQRFWFRFLVDAKVYEFRRRARQPGAVTSRSAPD